MSLHFLGRLFFTLCVFCFFFSVGTVAQYEWKVLLLETFEYIAFTLTSFAFKESKKKTSKKRNKNTHRNLNELNVIAFPVPFHNVLYEYFASFFLQMKNFLNDSNVKKKKNNTQKDGMNVCSMKTWQSMDFYSQKWNNISM